MTSAMIRAELLNARVRETVPTERPTKEHCPHDDGSGGWSHEGGVGSAVICCWCGLRGSRWTSYSTERIHGHGDFASRTKSTVEPVKWPLSHEHCDLAPREEKPDANS
jgi:hypothetical protein